MASKPEDANWLSFAGDSDSDAVEEQSTAVAVKQQEERRKHEEERQREEQKKREEQKAKRRQFHERAQLSADLLRQVREAQQASEPMDADGDEEASEHDELEQELPVVQPLASRSVLLDNATVTTRRSAREQRRFWGRQPANADAVRFLADTLPGHIRAEELASLARAAGSDEEDYATAQDITAWKRRGGRAFADSDEDSEDEDEYADSGVSAHTLAKLLGAA
ncbi:MAG: hypothetical protein MHM6MM_001521 [Cercozoa sp. M6MM]